MPQKDAQKYADLNSTKRRIQPAKMEIDPGIIGFYQLNLQTLHLLLITSMFVANMRH